MPRYSDRYSDRQSDRYSDRHSSSTRLYVGHLSSRTRTYDLEDIFNRYGRVRDVDMKRDYAFVEFSDPRDADDARHGLNGRDIDGSRIIVEFARGEPRGPGGSRDSGGRGPPPGSGRCFNCGLDGHWARDCKAGDWKNKCYRCGERGHIERNCQNSPKKLKRGRSYSRSPSPRRRSPSPRRGRSRSRSFSRSRSYSQSRSPPPPTMDRVDSPRPSPSTKRQRASPVASWGRRHSLSPYERSPQRRSSPSPSPKRQRASPVASRGRRHSLSPYERSPKRRGSLSPRVKKRANGSDYGDSPRPRSRSPTPRPKSRSPTPMPSQLSRSRSPMDYAQRAGPRNGDDRSPYEENGIDQVGSHIARNDDDYEASPGGSE